MLLPVPHDDLYISLRVCLSTCIHLNLTVCLKGVAKLCEQHRHANASMLRKGGASRSLLSASPWLKHCFGTGTLDKVSRLCLLIWVSSAVSSYTAPNQQHLGRRQNLQISTSVMGLASARVRSLDAM